MDNDKPKSKYFRDFDVPWWRRQAQPLRILSCYEVREVLGMSHRCPPDCSGLIGPAQAQPCHRAVWDPSRVSWKGETPVYDAPNTADEEEE
jgi:hypothetical protein